MSIKRKKCYYLNIIAFLSFNWFILSGECLASNHSAPTKEFFLINTKKTVPAPSPLEHLPVIVHGLGSIDGHLVTNSLEALIMNYRRGFRIFEVDLAMTSDNRLIARHDWTPQHYQFLGQKHPPISGPIPFDKVMSLLIHGQYHVISWEQLLAVMEIFPDLYIVTDTKDKDKRQVSRTFSYIVNSTKQLNPLLLERIIPQIYEPEMLHYIKDYHDFNNIILTTYQLTKLNSPAQIAKWCKENHITAVASFPFKFSEQLREELSANDIKIYLHTINNPNEAQNYRKQDIGIYSDYLFFDGRNYLYPLE